jgi:hypothetical protein
LIDVAIFDMPGSNVADKLGKLEGIAELLTVVKRYIAISELPVL